MAFTETKVNDIKVYQLPQSVYDSMFAANELDENAFYLTVNGEESDLNIEFIQTATSGNEIGTITINNTTTTLYSPEPRVISNTTSTEKLPILFTATTPTSGSNSAVAYNTNVTVLPSTGVLYGAAWNDYAEYRKFDGDKVEAGRVVTETGKDSVQYTNSRLQFAPAVISDTYGMVIGEDKEGNVPLAIGGKVLAYPYESRETYKVGDAVCSGPNGTVSRMTRKEIVEWPDRILGYYVGTPEDEEFNGVPVNGRIWIRIR